MDAVPELKGVPARSGLQIGTPQTGDLRAFNPDRDMVWSLARIVTRAMLEGFEIENPAEELTDAELVEHVEQQFAKHRIPQTLDAKALLAVFKEFLVNIRDFFGMAGEDDATLLASAAFEKIYTDERFKPFVLLLSTLTMRYIFAELPYWFEQVRPRSVKHPRPPIGDVVAAADALLKRLR
jgi:hypothetical protein